MGDQDTFAALFERHVRAVWNHAYRPIGSWSVADHAEAVVDRLSAGERVRALAAAVAALPKAQRRVVELCLLGGLPVPVAAQLLRLTESSVRAHLSRARARLTFLALMPADLQPSLRRRR
ncbi:sigma factor-like helix-turn-helix DNA-binding protein [Amycolatopsis lurida]